MKSIFHKTLALVLSVSMLAVYTPGFATERQVITDTQTVTDTFENLSYTGYGGALSITSSANVTVTDSTFSNNSATKGGAAIDNEGTLQITSSQFTNNSTDGRGGALSALGDITIESSTFNNNTAAGFGGGAIFQFSDPNATLTINNSSFQGNSVQNDASAYGGAIFVTDTTTIANSTFDGNSAIASDGRGGAIYNSGTLLLDNVSFNNNYATSYAGALAAAGNITIQASSFSNNSVGSENEEGQGGAILQFLDRENPYTLTVNNTVFSSNSATSSEATGGAVDIYSYADFDNATFTGNSVVADAAVSGGGAAHVGAESRTTFSNSTFSENTASYGGAIRTRDATLANNSAALLDITNSTFTSNSADNNGGAFYNNFYNSATTGDAVYMASDTFEQNSALNGGAIYNDGTADKAGNAGAILIKDSTFTNNTASENGGAIYNGGTPTLAGTNTFTGNTAAEGADIYNTGILNINDTTTIDGGIAGKGTINVNGTLNIGQAEVKAGTLAFANGSTLGVEFGNDNMGNLQADIVTIGDGANLQVTLSKDFLTTDTTTHDLITADTVTGAFTLANVNNALYNVSLNEDHQVIAQRKSQEEQNEAVEQAGGTSNDVTVTAAYTSSSDLGNDTTNKVADIINQLAQTDTAKLVEVTKAVAPEVAPAKQVVHTAVLNEVFGALQHRMADVSTGSPAMYALNDAKNYHTANTKHFSVWTQGLLNKSHKESTSQADAFTGRSTGVAAGADMKVGESGLVGLGYAYTHSNVNGTGRHDRILGNNFFLYGQYRPSAFYMQGSFAYGDAKYEESKYLPGLELDANYHVQHYAMQGRMGYDVTEWFSPNMGLRYTRLHQEGYTDGAQNVSAENADYFTGMLGADFQMEQRLSQHMSLLPHLYTGLSYDFVSDDNNSRVTLPNATGYNIVGERLHRLAFEIGAGVTARLYSSVEIALGYEGSFRQDYNAHTGTLKLRYLF